MFVATLCSGLVYLTVQQTLRLGANEPQRSMATDIAVQIKNGTRPQDLTSGHINIASNMAPFVVIYDSYGHVISGNGELDGTVQQVPIGVLQAGNENRQNATTWQPRSGVRIAVITQQAGGDYVLVGRSITKIENFFIPY